MARPRGRRWPHLGGIDQVEGLVEAEVDEAQQGGVKLGEGGHDAVVHVRGVLRAHKKSEDTRRRDLSLLYGDRGPSHPHREEDPAPFPASRGDPKPPPDPGQGELLRGALLGQEEHLIPPWMGTSAACSTEGEVQGPQQSQTRSPTQQGPSSRAGARTQGSAGWGGPGLAEGLSPGTGRPQAGKA